MSADYTRRRLEATRIPLRLRLDPAAPGMLPGEGERLDCARDGECLGRLILGHGRHRYDHPSGKLDAAHCPAGCSAFVARSRDEAFARATVRRAGALAEMIDVVALGEGVGA